MSTTPASQSSAPPESAPAGAVAVLTAAGSGSRLGAGVPKALVPLGGISLLRRAATGLIASGEVSHLVVTAPADDVERFRAELDGLTDGLTDDLPDGAPGGRRETDPIQARGAGTGIQVVAGSAHSRQASVALGLAAALAAVPQADVVVVHDAARALTPPEVTRRVIAAVRAGHEAVVPALPVTDTVKEVEAGEAGEPEPVVGTPRRARLRAVQTPQGFETGALVAAHRAGAQRAGDEALAASDDAGLVEARGGRVVVVAGDERAMKVTTPMDLALAELLLERRSHEGPRQIS
ncbi:2-C-methyl-D-erythritol 4-phosphate cytidylyltransferase [Actinomyces viscosus]|uniref:2-C-methyl-D-erythritol 4-phosphate cytidylyltransferase n=1 Tax=Actinomyces viscosus TaxID=1656 RepID=A0A3S4VB70_ACTVI|nr:2-C-methyl-D-erythritol 4-phosphate cytidylyltransferase [Actinomyces viscosus]TFH52663.1 2-C-methyl-D-erythritol 4-phosphate cytidylyltransferase [Actinomyces viscosus]VEI16894.1 2-C-methyl-D-erythritol 4-phosphate cytidylyltransferase [Actinomyces viscosus]